MKVFDDNSLSYFWNAIIKPRFSDKVDKELKTGSQGQYKVLSDNNFSDADKSKLDGLSGVYTFKGSVPTYADLPTENLTVGDVYDVQDDDINYAWTGTAWDKLGGTVDLTGYVKFEDLSEITNAEIDNICV